MRWPPSHRNTDPNRATCQAAVLSKTSIWVSITLLAQVRRMRSQKKHKTKKKRHCTQLKQRINCQKLSRKLNKRRNHCLTIHT